MVRAVLAVIVGYIVLAAVVFVLFTGAYFAMGMERAFEPGTFASSSMWLGMSIVVGLTAACIGGLTCRAIAKRARPVIALAVVVAVLGVIEAGVRTATYEEPGPRPAEMNMFEAASNAVMPLWLAWLNPVLGTVGVLIGGRAFGGERK